MFNIIQLIIWLVAGVITMFLNKNVSRLEYFLVWIVLIFYLIDRCIA